MRLKNKEIFIVCFFVALYLFTELVFPINSAFSHSLYDIDIECEQDDESYQHDRADNLNAYSNREIDDEETDSAEIDEDCFLGSLNNSEKPCCILQTNKLNLENILNVVSKPSKIIQLDDKSYQSNIIDTSIEAGNTLANLRTVILLN
jgi:hypothetical protein